MSRMTATASASPMRARSIWCTSSGLGAGESVACTAPRAMEAYRGLSARGGRTGRPDLVAAGGRAVESSSAEESSSSAADSSSEATLQRGIVVCRGVVVVGGGGLVVGGHAPAVAAVTTVGVRGRARLVLIGRSRRVVGGGVVGERPPLSRAKPGAWRPGQGRGGHSLPAPAHREKIGGRGQHRRGGGATRRRQLTVPGCCVLGSSV